MQNYKQIKNGVKFTENGWIRINTKGSPYEIGYTHGYLLTDELKEVVRMLKFVTPNECGYSFELLRDIIYDLLSPIVQKRYPDIFEEMKGIQEGARKGGFKDIRLEEIFFWNCWVSVESMLSYLPELVEQNPILNNKYKDVFHKGLPKKGGAKDKCTAFMAVGDWTKDGKIVCAHNSFDNYVDSQFCNVLLCIQPNNGNSFIMQTAPGSVSSGTDYYVTSNGFIVTETTIGGFNKYVLNDPIFCRIRKAVQYSTKLEDFVDTLTDGNSGDYANSWLIGDTKKNEIMRIELGLSYVNVEKKKNGYFIGFNAPYDPRIRNLECVNTGFYDIRRHQGARRVRLEQFMKKHKGELDISIGKSILADHYDVYLNKINPCSRTCCSHYDLDQREFMSQEDRPVAYQPRGAVDGIVCDTEHAKIMGLHARWGSSCGIPFIAKEFCDKHIQWVDHLPYLRDRPTEEWTLFSCKHKKGKHISRDKKHSKDKTRKK
jgi:hypothetical protein